MQAPQVKLNDIYIGHRHRLGTFQEAVPAPNGGPWQHNSMAEHPNHKKEPIEKDGRAASLHSHAPENEVS
jgi:hypothetical protein